MICEPNKCTGCGACMNRCARNCISMKEDKTLGHLYPTIDQKKCVDCGACVKVCPTINPMPLNAPLTAYAGWDKDDREYTSSTSGGAASAISRYIIGQGGVVYGCAMMPGVEVRHIRVDSLQDLCMLKGSKYVQSAMGSCYHDIRRDLRDGRKVLFIGTPCQVAGVKSYVGKNDDGLYTVDLICHGVPPQSFLKRHVLKVTHGVMPDEIHFRKNCYMLLLLLRGKVLYKYDLFGNRYKDTYYNTFFDGFSYRDSCYTCRYASPMRVSDLTIGDFWGLKGDLPLKHPHGCSVLLPTTSKGLEMVEGIKKDFHLFERTVEEAVGGNDQLRRPMALSLRWKCFRALVPLVGIYPSYRLVVLDKMVKKTIKKLIGRK